ncbi:MAG TPA: hypothetical protein PKM50_03585 [Methanoregula sp.]|nr:hypothetical protein [Methanoregula sp.]
METRVANYKRTAGPDARGSGVAVQKQDTRNTAGPVFGLKSSSPKRLRQYQKVVISTGKSGISEQHTGNIPAFMAEKSACADKEPGRWYDNQFFPLPAGLERILERLEKKVVRQCLRLRRIENRGWP